MYQYAQVTTRAQTYAEKKTSYLQHFQGNMSFGTTSRYNRQLSSLSTSEIRKLSNKLTTNMGNYRLKEAPTVSNVNFNGKKSSMTVKFYFSGKFEEFKFDRFIRNLENHTDYDLDITITEKKKGSVATLVKFVGKELAVHVLPGVFSLLSGSSCEKALDDWNAGDPVKNTVKGVGYGGTAGGAVAFAAAKTGAVVGTAAGPAGTAIGGGIGAVLGGITGWLFS